MSPAAPPSFRAEDVEVRVHRVAVRVVRRAAPAAGAGVRAVRRDRPDGAGARWPTSPATVATFTVDRLTFSPSPPLVAAVLDFEGGGRFRCELTDVDADDVAIGDRVEMTFRRVSTAASVHNYFWKARPFVTRRLRRRATHRRTAHGQSRDPRSGRDRRDGMHVFGEHWDKSADDLLVDAVGDALASADVEQAEVDAYWLGTMGSGISGLTLSRPLRLDYKPVTRVENMCATGSEAFRNACYAVASRCVRRGDGHRCREAQGRRLLGPHRRRRRPSDGTARRARPRRRCSACSGPRTARSTASTPTSSRTCSRASRGRTTATARSIRARSSARRCRRRRSPARRSWRATSASSTAPAFPTARRPRSSCGPRTPTEYTDHPIFVKGSVVRGRPRGRCRRPDYDYTTFREVVAAAEDAYQQAGITDPRGAARDGRGARLLHADRARAHGGPRVRRARLWRGRRCSPARFDLDGELPVNPDGGLEGVRPPDRRVGAPHAVRVLAAAARRGRRAPDRDGGRGQDARPHPQPRRLARRVRELRRRRGLGADRRRSHPSMPVLRRCRPRPWRGRRATTSAPGTVGSMLIAIARPSEPVASETPPTMSGPSAPPSVSRNVNSAKPVPRMCDGSTSADVAAKFANDMLSTNAATPMPST